MLCVGLLGKIRDSLSLSVSLSLQPPRKVKMAIEEFLRQKFSCDYISISSADEYHCNQRDKVSILKANVSTFYAKDRVERFYSYLQNERISLFDDSVDVSVDEGPSTPPPGPHSGSSMVYVYVIIIVTVLLFLVIVFFIVTIAMVVKKSKKKPLK